MRFQQFFSFLCWWFSAVDGINRINWWSQPNVFVLPDEQNQACLSYAMAKRVDELAAC